MSKHDDNFIDNIDRDIRRSKFAGIFFDKHAGKFRVRMTGGSVKWYGLFPTAETAKLSHKRTGGIFTI